MGADSAVVAPVKFMKMGLFVAITGPGIQNDIPCHPWKPTAPFQSFCRASINASRTFAAAAFFSGLSGFKGCVGEHGAKTHPGSPEFGNKLAVFTDPAQTSTCGGRLVLKIATDIHWIAACGRRQSPRLVSGPVQCPDHLGGKGIYAKIYLPVENRIGFGWALVKLRHNPGFHREYKGYAPMEASQFPFGEAFKVGIAIKRAAVRSGYSFNFFSKLDHVACNPIPVQCLGDLDIPGRQSFETHPGGYERVLSKQRSPALKRNERITFPTQFCRHAAFPKRGPGRPGSFPGETIGKQQARCRPAQWFQSGWGTPQARERCTPAG